MKQWSWRNIVYWFVPRLMFNYIHFSCFSGPLAKGEVTDNGLGTPISIVSQEHAPQACLFVIFWKHFFC